LVLCKENAVKTWRDLLGPANSKRAKEEKPNSFRAEFGVDSKKNALHGSDSSSLAAKDIAYFFSPNIPTINPPYFEIHGLPEVREKTVAVIGSGLVKYPELLVKSKKGLKENAEEFDFNGLEFSNGFYLYLL
jgi:hypothetical protein